MASLRIEGKKVDVRCDRFVPENCEESNSY